MSEHPKSVSGFGYCDHDGMHHHVQIFQIEDGRYYLSFDYFKSEPFNSIKEVEEIWKAVAEVEEMRKLANETN